MVRVSFTKSLIILNSSLLKLQHVPAVPWRHWEERWSRWCSVERRVEDPCTSRVPRSVHIYTVDSLLWWVLMPSLTQETSRDVRMVLKHCYYMQMFSTANVRDDLSHSAAEISDSIKHVYTRFMRWNSREKHTQHPFTSTAFTRNFYFVPF